MANFFYKNNFFLISLGAAPAALVRWQTDEIFIVNIVGCFLLGFINALNIARKYKLMFGFGFCGSLTTFSGWSLQLFQLITSGSNSRFFVNSLLIVFVGLLAIALGNFLAKKIIINLSK